VSVDLEQAEGRLGAVAARQRLSDRRRVKNLFYRPAPLRVTQEAGNAIADGLAMGANVDLTLYDFGAISVSYRAPFETSLERLIELSIALRASQPLAADARRRVTELVHDLGAALQRPRIADLVEDYLIIQLDEAGPEGATAFCEAHAAQVARILRAERGHLSAEEVRDATQARISFAPTDITMVDWDAALIVGPEPEEVRAVLEMANVQLLEMRFLDRQLDQVLEHTYDLLTRRGGWRSVWPAALAGDLRRVAELQLEGAILQERVTNALKFIGEEYLDRIYRLVARRFHLAEWDAGIGRKLATLESLYQKLSDRAATRRMELLEWVVIILIALEVVLSLAGRR
jgi:hypothetical protein